jgi:hypothetical protein
MPGPTRTLAEALAAWDRDAIQPQLAAAEAERLGVISRFPLAEWPILTVTRALRAHRSRQLEERIAGRPGWNELDLVFVKQCRDSPRCPQRDATVPGRPGARRAAAAQVP